MIYNYEPYQFTATLNGEIYAHKDIIMKLRAEYEAKQLKKIQEQRKELLEYDRYDQSED
jgi:hypothetical protein